MEKFVLLDETNKLSISHFKTGKGESRVKITKMWKPAGKEDFLYTKIGFSLNEEQAAKFKKRLGLVVDDLDNAKPLEKVSKKKDKDRGDDADD